MKVLELFAGIGACSKALERLGIEHEIIDAVEIDKYAIESFNAIHNTNFEPQDITKWDKDIEVDLIMHGSPCQDFSLAGLQAGGDEGSGTRSSLMYETIRIVEKLKPKYVIWENVKNILSKKHRHNFDNYLEKMEELGYKNYYQVLNAKDYGIPQNRERIFTVSILGDDDYNFPNGEENKNQIKRLFNFSARQDCRVVYDKNGLSPTLVAGMGEGGGKVPMFIENGFEFPPKQELKLRLKDMLEDEVDEKYYLDDAQVERIKTTTYNVGKTRVQEKEYCDTLCARDFKDPKCVRIGGIFDTEKSTHQAGSIYDKEGLSPTLDVMQGGWRQPSIITHNITQKVKVRLYPVDIEALKTTLRNAKLNVDLNNKEIVNSLQIPQTQVEHYFRTDNSFAIPSPEIWLKLKELLKIETDYFDESIMTFEEKDNEYDISNRVYDTEGIAPTQTIQNDAKILEKNNNLRIRKLTPLECWRLQGFDDDDFYKAKERLNNVFYKGRDNSNSQLYKQAGNSITVNVLEKIFMKLF